MSMKRLALTTTVAVLGLGALAVAALPAGASTTAPPAPADENACVNGHWPAEDQGRPASLAAGAAEGAYLWHNADGWHLFVTHPGNERVVFTGRIVSSGRIDGVGRRAESHDKVAVSKHDRIVGFRFTNFGHLDGVEFRTRCAQHLRFELRINGTRITPEEVYVGVDAHHPSHTPFEVSRVAS